MRGGRLFVAGALCLPVLALSACQDTEQPLGAPSASPAQTLITPHTAKGKVKAKPTKAPKQKMVHSLVKGGARGSAARTRLDAVAAQTQVAMESLLNNGLDAFYSSVRVQPDYPSGFIFTFVLRQKVPAGAVSQIEAQAAQFQSNFSSTLAPALASKGFANPTATFTFKNPDGSVVWTRTFHG